MKTNKIEFEIPNTCGECIFYTIVRYKVHNEEGWEARCNMGYMKNEDMRDRKLGKLKYPGCKLDEENQIIETLKGYKPLENQ